IAWTVYVSSSIASGACPPSNCPAQVGQRRAGSAMRVPQEGHCAGTASRWSPVSVFRQKLRIVGLPEGGDGKRKIALSEGAGLLLVEASTFANVPVETSSF